MRIADIFLRMVADDTGFEADVEKKAGKAATVAGKSLGKQLSGSLRTEGFKAIGLAASAAAAIATKGTLELDEVQANFQAQTGASAEAASHAADVINKVAGDNVLSLKAVSDIAIKVHNDLGLVGDAADAMTAKIAKFARVTGQDGAGAVKALDDITDAWNLTAEQQATVLDKLLVSQQRYGGVMTDNQTALAATAPQMQALNADVDDGIGLLNLFNASGVDGTKAVAALNAAVKNLKPGQDINDLVHQISSIEDPTLRAQAAIKIFGKQGSAISQVLKPGINSLKDFAVSTTDAAGATNEAANVIDSSWRGRIAKAISRAQAALRGFGKDLGPAVTAAATVASLFASTGLFNGVGSKFATGLVGAVKGSAGAIESGLNAIIGPSVARAIFGAQTSSIVQGAISRLWTPLVAAASSAGTAAGTAFSVAATAAIVALPVIVTYVLVQGENDRRDSQQKSISDAVEKVVSEGSIEGLTKARDQLKQYLKIEQTQDSGVNGFIRNLFGGVSESAAMQADLDKVEAALSKRAGEIGRAFGEHAATGVEDSAPAIAKAGQTAADNIAKGMLASGAVTHIDALGKALGAEIPKSIADGALSHQAEVPNALDKLIDLMKNATTRRSRITRDIGILTGKQLVAGLHDVRGVVRAEAQHVQADAEQELARLILSGGKVGKDAMDALKKAIHSKDPEVRAAGHRTQAIVDATLQGTVKPAGQAGADAGSAYARNLLGGVSRALAQARMTTAAAKHDDAHRATGGPIRAGTAYWVNERTPRSEMIVAPSNGYVLTHADAMAAAGSVGGNAPLIGNLTINAGGNTGAGDARRFGTAVVDVIKQQLREERRRQ